MHRLPFHLTLIALTLTLFCSFSARAEGSSSSRSSKIPEWCGTFKHKNPYYFGGAKSFRKDYSVEKGPSYKVSTLVEIHAYLCSQTSNPERIEDLANIHSAVLEVSEEWKKALGLTDADLADIAPLLEKYGDPSKNRSSTYATPKRLAGHRTAKLVDLNAVTEPEFIRAMAYHPMIGYDFAEAAWWLDAIPAPKMATKAEFVHACDWAMRNSNSISKAVIYGVCRQDMMALDRAVLDAELATIPDLTPEERLSFRISFGLAAAMAASIEKKIQEFIEEDPGMKTLAMDIPEKALAAWSELDTPGSVFAVAREIEDGYRSGKRSQLQGCEEKLMPFWNDILGQARTEEMDSFEKTSIVSSPTGYALAYAVALCQRDGKKPEQMVANHFGALLRNTPDWRGPRFAVMNAIATQGPKIVFDDRSHSFSRKSNMPKFEAKTFSQIVPQGCSGGAINGQVVKVEPKEEGVLVTFKKGKEKIRLCAEWRETKKVIRIEPITGNVVYDSYCVKEESKMIETGSAPVLVPAFLAEGIAPGRWVTTRACGNGTDEPAFPFEVWDGKAKKKLISRFGIPATNSTNNKNNNKSKK